MEGRKGKGLLGNIAVGEVEGCPSVFSNLRGQGRWPRPTFEMSQGGVNLDQLTRTENVRPVIGIS